MRASIILLVTFVFLTNTAWSQGKQRVVESISTMHGGPVTIIRLNSAANNLYVVQGSELTVIDTDESQVKGSISFVHDLTGLALADDLDLAIAALAEDDSLVFIDLNGNNVSAKLKSKVRHPDSVIYDSAARRFIVASSQNSQLQLVSPDNQLQEQIEMPERVAAVAANGRGWIFAAAAGVPEVHVLNSLSGLRLGSFPITGCEYPTGLAIDDAERRLYVSCSDGHIFALDSDIGVILGRQNVAPGSSGIDLRTVSNRTLQLFVAVRDRQFNVFQGRIVADTLYSSFTELGNGAAVQADGNSNRVYLATGSTVSVLAIQ